MLAELSLNLLFAIFFLACFLYKVLSKFAMEVSPTSSPSKTVSETNESKTSDVKVRGYDVIDSDIAKGDLPVRRTLDFSKDMDQTPDPSLETSTHPPSVGIRKRYYAPLPKPLALSFCYTLNQNKQLTIGLDSENKYETKIHINKLDSPRNAVIITRADWAFIKSKCDEITRFFAGDSFDPCTAPSGKLHLQMETENNYSPCLMLAHDSISAILLQFSTWRIFLRLVPVIDAHLEYNLSVEKAFSAEGAADQINSYALDTGTYIKLLKEIKLCFKPLENVSKQKNTYIVRRVVVDSG